MVVDLDDERAWRSKREQIWMGSQCPPGTHTPPQDAPSKNCTRASWSTSSSSQGMRCFLTYSRKPCAGMGSAKWTCVACPLALWPTHAHRRARQLHAVLRIAVHQCVPVPASCMPHVPRPQTSSTRRQRGGCGARAHRWARGSA